jgi:hypothetical protein
MQLSSQHCGGGVGGGGGGAGGGEMTQRLPQSEQSVPIAQHLQRSSRGRL